MTRSLFGQNELRRIGRQVRLIREKSSMSQADLAKAAGLSARAVRDLEAGRSNPTLATMAAIVEVLDVTLDQLVSAARTDTPLFDLTHASEEAPAETALTRALPEPKMRARMIRLDGAPGETALPHGAAFAHVLSGSIRVTLDGEEFRLGPGDSFHARSGVAGGFRALETPTKLLIVEVTEGADGANDHIRGTA